MRNCILYGRRIVRDVFEPAEPLSRSASAAAADLIRTAIVEGRLAPGQRLKEEELARSLGISRTPIREALLVLQTEGLIEASPNRGATVPSYDLGDLQDMYDLRALLEGHAARRAAGRIGEEQLAVLRESCVRFERRAANSDARELVAENMLFHETIHAASGNRRLGTVLRQTIAIPLVYRSYIWYSPEETLRSLQHHVALVAALERRDADGAEGVMREHVLEARDVLVAHMLENVEVTT